MYHLVDGICIEIRDTTAEAIYKWSLIFSWKSDLFVLVIVLTTIVLPGNKARWPVDTLDLIFFTCELPDSLHSQSSMLRQGEFTMVPVTRFTEKQMPSPAPQQPSANGPFYTTIPIKAGKTNRMTLCCHSLDVLPRLLE